MAPFMCCGIPPPQKGTKVHLLYAWLSTDLWVTRVAYAGTRDSVPESLGEVRVLGTFILAALMMKSLRDEYLSQKAG